MANSNPSPETRFQTGNNANPGGRPKGKSFGKRIRELFDSSKLVNPKTGKTVVLLEGFDMGDFLAYTHVMRAAKGSQKHLHEILDRAFGKAPESQPEGAVDMKEVARKAKELRDRRKANRTGGQRPD